jgi:hypothetical protein
MARRTRFCAAATARFANESPCVAQKRRWSGISIFGGPARAWNNSSPFVKKEWTMKRLALIAALERQSRQAQSTADAKPRQTDVTMEEVRLQTAAESSHP